MKTTYFLIFSTVLLFSSCIVSKKKFDDMLAQKIKAEGELTDRNNQLDKANASLAELNESTKKMQEDTTSLGQTYRANQKKLAGLNKEYDMLNGNYKNLLTNSGKLNRDVAQQRDQLLAIQEDKRKLDNPRILLLSQGIFKWKNNDWCTIQ